MSDGAAAGKGMDDAQKEWLSHVNEPGGEALKQAARLAFEDYYKRALLSARQSKRLLIHFQQAIIAYHCYDAEPEAEQRAELSVNLDQYAEFEAEHRGEIPTAPPLQPPAPLPDPAPPLGGDAVMLYPDHDGRAMYAYVDIGPWPQRVLIDTGATSLTVTEPLAQRLLAQGFAHEGPEVTTTLADGSEREERTVLIDSVTIGSHVLRDVRAGVTPDGADMLLGLPVLNQIGPFKIDSANHKLTFG